MLNSKERAFLRGLASKLDTTIYVGKNGISDTLCTQIEEEFAVRELIKGKVLENAMLTPREVCDDLAARMKADPVQVIGSKFVLYRPNSKLDKEKRIALPKGKK